MGQTLYHLNQCQRFLEVRYFHCTLFHKVGPLQNLLINYQKDRKSTVQKIEIEENLPFQENIISEAYERPDKSYFQEPVELKDLIDTNNIIQRFLLKQTDIDKILEIIRKKVLKGTHLPLTIKEIQAGYLNSLYFKDIYLYLAQNRLLTKKAAIKRIEVLAEKYIMLDSLLFKLTTIPGRETVHFWQFLKHVQIR